MLLVVAWKALQFPRHLHGEDGWTVVTDERLLPCQRLEGPPPQFPHLDTESSACPPLMSLWNPSWGPLFSAHLPPLHSAAALLAIPLLPFPHPQPLTLAGLPPPPPHIGHQMGS
ncbi:similar to RIKEN cDNA 2900073H19 (predicted), isoform CRA_a [Rattus norvegicus]|uniref:Similar to RIKEN cDNA 2900073H19 (Predicted), isoform CRA_a n=1 Tax=Rattus norvegicus TaxID=10116 RepID=A6JTS6_RAT|nr:similar to RIKEN cDNA 2900073H19 (predicted), isoform CRA_a [Rattus norvegicus]